MKTQRIAVSGMPKSNRALIANALSLLTNLPFIQGRTMHEWCKSFNVKAIDEMSWKEAFLVSSSAFIDRIEMEKAGGSFVSDGAVFTELIYLKLAKKHRKGKGDLEQEKIMASLENVCLDYAARSYDCIIHICSPDQHRIEGEREVIRKMFDSRNVPCQMYDSEHPAETLSRILLHLNSPTKITAENALYMAEKNLYIGTL